MKRGLCVCDHGRQWHRGGTAPCSRKSCSCRGYVPREITPVAGSASNSRVRIREGTTSALHGAAERAVVEADGTLADSRLEGFALISFWTGGPIPGGHSAMHFMLSAGLDEASVVPLLRAVADQLGAARG